MPNAHPALEEELNRLLLEMHAACMVPGRRPTPAQTYPAVDVDALLKAFRAALRALPSRHHDQARRLAADCKSLLVMATHFLRSADAVRPEAAVAFEVSEPGTAAVKVTLPPASGAAMAQEARRLCRAIAKLLTSADGGQQP